MRHMASTHVQCLSVTTVVWRNPESGVISVLNVAFGDEDDYVTNHNPCNILPMSDHFRGFTTLCYP